MGPSQIGSPLTPDLVEYLRDESRYTGWAESISFPASEKEVKEHLAEARALGRSVTIQGARTGITGGAVPEGGHVLNLSRMTGVEFLQRDRNPVVRVEPGLSLNELRTLVREHTAAGYFFPPDPTETSASLGGMISCNASGACSFAYGPTRRYVDKLRVVLADGSAIEVSRGEDRARGRRFEILSDCRAMVSGELPCYPVPSVKNAAGYWVGEDQDLVDLFIAAEGTLGVITRADLILVPSPAAQLAVLAFLPGDEAAVELVQAIRGSGAVAIEFFDRRALSLLRSAGAGAPVPLPDLPPERASAVYVEYHGAESHLEQSLLELSDCIEKLGGSAEDAWLASGDREMARLKKFRHAVPEAVNRLVADRQKTEPSLTKLGSDLAVSDAHLKRIMGLYREGLEKAGLSYVIFGHIGNNHLHVNILPRNRREYETGRELYATWASEVVQLGGTVSAEHGIGKLKRDLLRQMYGDAGIAQMKALKTKFDPSNFLNPGNLFSV
jgi:D-lactate dehydrogenase (cytochrome)